MFYVCPKRVVSISLGSRSRDHRVEIELLGQRIVIERIGTDGDVRRAKALYEELDGQVDCLGVGGAVLWIDALDRRYELPQVFSLIENVRQTPVVDGSGFKNVVECQMAQVIEREIGQAVERKAVLITSAVDRLGLTLSFVEAGYEVVYGDLMFALGLPVAVRSLAGLNRLAHLLGPIVRHLPMSMLYPTGEREDVNTPRLDTRSFGTNVMEAVLVALAGKGRALEPHEVEELLEALGWGPNVEKLN